MYSPRIESRLFCAYFQKFPAVGGGIQLPRPTLPLQNGLVTPLARVVNFRGLYLLIPDKTYHYVLK